MKKNIIFRILNTIMLSVGAMASILFAYLLFLGAGNHIGIGESNVLLRYIEIVTGVSAFIYLAIKAIKSD